MSTPFDETVGNFGTGGADFTYGDMRDLAQKMADQTTPDNLLMSLIRDAETTASGVRSMATAVVYLLGQLEEAQASEAA